MMLCARRLIGFVRMDMRQTHREKMQPKIVIIAALPREISGLVRGWKNDSRPKEKTFLYTRGSAVVACAGMGAQRAVLATRAALKYGPVAQIFSGLSATENPRGRSICTATKSRLLRRLAEVRATS